MVRRAVFLAGCRWSKPYRKQERSFLCKAVAVLPEPILKGCSVCSFDQGNAGRAVIEDGRCSAGIVNFNLRSCGIGRKSLCLRLKCL
jgi:hypothetical protein